MRPRSFALKAPRREWRPARFAVGALTIGLTTLATVPTPSHAQTRVEGIVRDSLRGNQPVANALVELLGTTLRVRTQSDGRFVLEAVPRGAAVLQVSGPWLDSLGLAPLQRSITVSGRSLRPLLLSTPSLRSYRRAACGTADPPNRGVLRGEVRSSLGPAVAQASVEALWTEAILTEQGLTYELMATADTTDAGGNYTLCGIPLDVEVLFRVRAGSAQTGDIALALHEQGAVARFDALVSDTTASATLRGRVLTADGSPLPSAVVERPGTGIAVRVDSSGAFVLRGIPQRSEQLRVRALGFSPELVPIAPSSAEVELAPVRLSVAPTLLSEVRITAEGPRTLAALEFGERQRRGGALFIDDEARRRQPILSARVIESMGTGLRSTRGVNPRLLMSRSAHSSSPCFPVFYVDGIRIGTPVDAQEELRLFQDAVRVEVHGYASIPARYPDPMFCGVVLLWTQ